MQTGYKPTAKATPKRRDRLIKEHVHDPYHVRHKPAEGTGCPDCGLVFHGGAWGHGTPAVNAARYPCPACQRVRDRMPAGMLTLSGSFLEPHRQEILNLARHVGKREGTSHPLHRIMGIVDEESHVVVTTTDVHLPQAIGRALQKAYSGDLTIAYGEDSYSVRVNWSRD